jgi:hypothetical protein
MPPGARVRDALRPPATDGISPPLPGGGSSNGRTADSDSAYRGSNPRPPTMTMAPGSGGGASRSTGSPRRRAVSTRNGPPCVMTTWSPVAQSAAKAWTRAFRAAPVSPFGGAKLHGSAAQRSRPARGTMSHARPSQSPKSSSCRRGSTLWAPRASATRRHLWAGLVQMVGECGRSPPPCCAWSPSPAARQRTREGTRRTISAASKATAAGATSRSNRP